MTDSYPDTGFILPPFDARDLTVMVEPKAGADDIRAHQIDFASVIYTKRVKHFILVGFDVGRGHDRYEKSADLNDLSDYQKRQKLSIGFVVSRIYHAP
jgi:hypothetical protein